MRKQIRNVLGPKIKLFREVSGLTQVELVARLNVYGLNINNDVLSRIESQTRCLYDYEIIAIAKALKISYKDLFR